jgi:hypothetical protein
VIAAVAAAMAAAPPAAVAAKAAHLAEVAAVRVVRLAEVAAVRAAPLVAAAKAAHSAGVIAGVPRALRDRSVAIPGVRPGLSALIADRPRSFAHPTAAAADRLTEEVRSSEAQAGPTATVRCPDARRAKFFAVTNPAAGRPVVIDLRIYSVDLAKGSSRIEADSNFRVDGPVRSKFATSCRCAATALNDRPRREVISEMTAHSAVIAMTGIAPM